MLPCLTAIDLLRSRGEGESLAFRAPTAALTVLVPLFSVLELRKLQSIELPEAPDAINESVGPLRAAQVGHARRLSHAGPCELCQYTDSFLPSQRSTSLHLLCSGVCELVAPAMAKQLILVPGSSIQLQRASVLNTQLLFHALSMIYSNLHW